MYRVMIIDDEKALRNLLKKAIDWDALSLQVVGEAASGIEAINTIDDIKPDIVFVDIRMPFMDGIEFSRLAMKRYPSLKIIILTAFDDFSYARECIGIGICEYLVKPIVREEIMECLNKLIPSINKEELIEDTVLEITRSIKMEHIKKYLEQNYANADINLTSVANRFGFNASYLSRKFKEEIGKSLIDYLTCFRMEMACQCAKEEKLMYIAAGEVGIPDPNYFSKCFKKYKEVSYTEYMKVQKQ